MDPQSRPLIGTDELAAHLGDPDLAIVDCRHQLLDRDAGRRSFLDSHIPGARHAHLDKDLARLPGSQDGRHPLPAPEVFVETLRRLGVSQHSRVVAYDDGNAAMASRLWWMLRWLGHEQVSVLDGGMAAWTAASLPVETGQQPGVRGNFATVTIHDDWIIEVTELQKLLRDGCVVLLDARASDRFNGLAEPIDAVAGHIPGATNLPYERLLNAQGKFSDVETLRALFDDVVPGRSPREIVAMCGSGVTACHLLLGMEAAGMGMARLYAGSWSEWIRDPSRPIGSHALV